MCYKNEDWCKIWRVIGLSSHNWHEKFDKFWPKLSKNLNIYTLMGCFWPKYIMFELKKYGGVMFDDTEYWCKIWKKTYLCFQKWHEEFAKFSPEHLKVSKLGLWWDPFIQSRKCTSLKFTRELFVTTMKSNAKLEEELTYQSKIDSRNLMHFDPSTPKSQKNCTLMGCFWAKYIILELKKYKRVMFDSTEDWCKIWRKLTCAFKNDIKNLANFHSQAEK